MFLWIRLFFLFFYFVDFVSKLGVIELLLGNIEIVLFSFRLRLLYLILF